MRRGPRLTYANVVATLALVIAVGGASAFAASRLPKNSVGTRQIKDEAITAAKIKAGAVTAAKIDLTGLGTVPSASHADSADTATSARTATSADTAISATDTRTLDGATAAQIAAGSKLTCPTGMAPAAGTCIETAIRTPASFLAASQICGEANLALPSMGELIAYEAQLSSAPLKEWIGQMYFDGTNFRGFDVSTQKGLGAGIFAAPLAAELEPYRCAQGPGN